MNTRREIMKLFGLAPIAASSSAGALAEMVSSPAIASAVTLAGAAASNLSAAPSSFGVLGPILGKQFQKLQRAYEDEKWIRINTRNGQFDPDIACFRSLPAGTKARMQLERDIQRDDLLRRASSMMWGET